MVNQQVYQFTCLPFGLATSPSCRKFTKIPRPVVQLLCRIQLLCIPWQLANLDGLAIPGEFPCTVIYQSAILLGLSYQIWANTSDTHTRFQFICMDFRTSDFTIAPLPKMLLKVQKILDHWRLSSTVSALDVHRLGDVIQYMALLVLRGQLHFRPIQWWALEAWDQSTQDWSTWITVQGWVLHR